MEDNKTPEAPTPCTAGCGFYGNKIYNNMCSKCFKELDERNKTGLIDTSILKVDNKNNLNHTPLLTKELTEEPSIQEPRAEPVKEEHPKEEEREQGPKKIVQKNKGRCFSCRLKIPLAKQLTNKCRCEYVFCDNHRYPDKHDCHFDHAQNDKDILARNNPKLNEKPRGGNSFNRIDSL